MTNLTADQIENYAQKIFHGDTIDITPQDVTEQDRIEITNRVAKLKADRDMMNDDPDEKNDPANKIGIEGEKPDDNDNDDDADEDLEMKTRRDDDNVEESGQLAGGLDIPDGYNLIATITSGQGDSAQSVPVKNVLPNAKVVDHTNLVSCAFDRGVYDKTSGTILARIIHDGGSRAYVYRRDDKEEGTTYFHCALSHQALPISF
jgi:hypothetical protein